jgi:hypothetical protein
MSRAHCRAHCPGLTRPEPNHQLLNQASASSRRRRSTFRRCSSGCRNADPGIQYVGALPAVNFSASNPESRRSANVPVLPRFVASVR